jgi:hypothetical protein
VILAVFRNRGNLTDIEVKGDEMIDVGRSGVKESNQLQPHPHSPTRNNYANITELSTSKPENLGKYYLVRNGK